MIQQSDLSSTYYSMPFFKGWTLAAAANPVLVSSLPPVFLKNGIEVLVYKERNSSNCRLDTLNRIVSGVFNAALFLKRNPTEPVNIARERFDYTY